MKVYDGFIFDNELDLLELRLRTLDSVVDYFVLCELPVNFQQNTKRMHFRDNKHRFAQWLPKIRLVDVPAEFPIGPHPVIEHYQRRMIAQGFYDASPSDWLLMGDVDEIPHPDAITALSISDIDHACTFGMDLYYYYVNCKMPMPWLGTVIFPRRAVGDIDCQRLRDYRFNFPKVPGGWHFSWLGTTAQVQAKMMSIDVPRDLALYPVAGMVAPDAADVEFIEQCRAEGKDLFKRDLQLEFVPIKPGEFQPKQITEWLEQYPQYAKQAETVA